MRSLSALTVAVAMLTGCESSSSRELIDIDGPGLLRMIRSGAGPLTVINVWATWCGPCKEEFPDLLAVARAYKSKGVRLAFVSTDFGPDRAAAVEFLKAQGAPLPSYIKAGKDEAFIEALDPRWVGTLPATVIFDNTGRRVKFFQGKLDKSTLERTLDALLAGDTTKDNK